MEFPIRFRDRLQKKPPALQAAILKCLERLGDDPRHPGLNVHRVQGSDGAWEAYVDDSNRVTFEFGPHNVIVLRNHCNHDIIRRSP
ncbi:MAG: hypothetical protein ABSB75_02205 [Candidatus Limnocylindrales bacterium]